MHLEGLGDLGEPVPMDPVRFIDAQLSRVRRALGAVQQFSY
jgi:hypothetical protein